MTTCTSWCNIVNNRNHRSQCFAGRVRWWMCAAPLSCTPSCCVLGGYWVGILALSIGHYCALFGYTSIMRVRAYIQSLTHVIYCLLIFLTIDSWHWLSNSVLVFEAWRLRHTPKCSLIIAFFLEVANYIK